MLTCSTCGCRWCERRVRAAAAVGYEEILEAARKAVDNRLPGRALITAEDLAHFIIEMWLGSKRRRCYRRAGKRRFRAAFFAFVNEVARNAVATADRKNLSWRQVEATEAAYEPDESAVEAAEAVARLDRELAGDPKKREYFRYYRECYRRGTIPDPLVVAEIFGVKPGSVKTTEARTRRHIREVAARIGVIERPQD